MHKRRLCAPSTASNKINVRGRTHQWATIGEKIIHNINHTELLQTSICWISSPYDKERKPSSSIPKVAHTRGGADPPRRFHMEPGKQGGVPTPRRFQTKAHKTRRIRSSLSITNEVLQHEEERNLLVNLHETHQMRRISASRRFQNPQGEEKRMLLVNSKRSLQGEEKRILLSDFTRCPQDEGLNPSRQFQTMPTR